MSEGFAYIDILFFAMVAAFIALRLRSVLGRRTGQERRRAADFGAARSNGAARQRGRPARPLALRPPKPKPGSPTSPRASSRRA